MSFYSPQSNNGSTNRTGAFSTHSVILGSMASGNILLGFSWNETNTAANKCTWSDNNGFAWREIYNCSMATSNDGSGSYFYGSVGIANITSAQGAGTISATWDSAGHIAVVAAEFSGTNGVTDINANNSYTPTVTSISTSFSVPSGNEGLICGVGAVGFQTNNSMNSPANINGSQVGVNTLALNTNDSGFVGYECSYIQAAAIGTQTFQYNVVSDAGGNYLIMAVALNITSVPVPFYRAP